MATKSFGFLTQQISNFHRDLLAFQKRTEEGFAQIDKRFDKVDGRFDKIDDRLDHVETGLNRLRTDMPKIVGDAMREQRNKSR